MSSAFALSAVAATRSAGSTYTDAGRAGGCWGFGSCKTTIVISLLSRESQFEKLQYGQVERYPVAVSDS